MARVRLADGRPLGPGEQDIASLIDHFGPERCALIGPVYMRNSALGRLAEHEQARQWLGRVGDTIIIKSFAVAAAAATIPVAIDDRGCNFDPTAFGAEVTRLLDLVEEARRFRVRPKDVVTLEPGDFFSALSFCTASSREGICGEHRTVLALEAARTHFGKDESRLASFIARESAMQRIIESARGLDRAVNAGLRMRAELLFQPVDGESHTFTLHLAVLEAAAMAPVRECERRSDLTLDAGCEFDAEEFVSRAEHLVATDPTGDRTQRRIDEWFEASTL